MELDDEVGSLPMPASGDISFISEDRVRKAAIVRLGLVYQLVSKYTSFVAIQQESEQQTIGAHKHTGPPWTTSTLNANHGYKQDDTNLPVPEPEPTFLNNLVNGLSAVVTSVYNSVSGPPPPSPTTSSSSSWSSRSRLNIPGTYRSSDSDASEESSDREHGPEMERLEIETTTEGIYKVDSDYLADLARRAPSPEFLKDTDVEGLEGAQFHHCETEELPNTADSSSSWCTPVSQDVYDLLMQMDLDGSFASSCLLTRLVGDAVLNKGDELGIDKRVWATVVAAAYLKKNLQHELDLLELLSEKAREFVEGLGGVGARGFDELVRDASAALIIWTITMEILEPFVGVITKALNTKSAPQKSRDTRRTQITPEPRCHGRTTDIPRCHSVGSETPTRSLSSLFHHSEQQFGGRRGNCGVSDSFYPTASFVTMAERSTAALIIARFESYCEPIFVNRNNSQSPHPFLGSCSRDYDGRRPGPRKVSGVGPVGVGRHTRVSRRMRCFSRRSLQNLH